MQLQRYKQDRDFEDYPVGSPHPNPEGEWVRFDELGDLQTSALPKTRVRFSKDTLVGTYKGYRREIWSHAARSVKDGHGGNDGVQMFFALIKPDKEAVIFAVFTGWAHPRAIEHWKEQGISHLRTGPEGGAVDFHWTEPQWEGQDHSTDCTLIDGGVCYGNTGFTLGEKIFEALCIGGFDAVWETLYEYLRIEEQNKEESE